MRRLGTLARQQCRLGVGCKVIGKCDEPGVSSAFERGALCRRLRKIGSRSPDTSPEGARRASRRSIIPAISICWCYAVRDPTANAATSRIESAGASRTCSPGRPAASAIRTTNSARTLEAISVLKAMAFEKCSRTINFRLRSRTHGVFLADEPTAAYREPFLTSMRCGWLVAASPRIIRTAALF